MSTTTNPPHTRGPLWLRTIALVGAMSLAGIAAVACASDTPDTPASTVPNGTPNSTNGGSGEPSGNTGLPTSIDAGVTTLIAGDSAPVQPVTS